MHRLTTSLALKIAAFFVFLGRAWQHLFWDAPYRSLFWDESLLKPLVENLTAMSWQEYATSEVVDTFAQQIIFYNGIIYGVAAFTIMIMTKKNIRFTQFPIVIGGVSLLILTVLMTKEKFYHVAQFFEHSIQFGTPFVLFLFYKKSIQQQRLTFILKILVAATFCSHGLYALGVYPVPGNFVDMVINILGTSEQQALLLLYVVGILDIIIAVLIFIPKTAKIAIWYALIWGLLTAFARIFANLQFDFLLASLHQNLYHVMYRLSHGLVPLAILITLPRFSKK